MLRLLPVDMNPGPIVFNSGQLFWAECPETTRWKRRTTKPLARGMQAQAWTVPAGPCFAPSGDAKGAAYCASSLHLARMPFSSSRSGSIAHAWCPGRISYRRRPAVVVRQRDHHEHPGKTNRLRHTANNLPSIPPSEGPSRSPIHAESPASVFHRAREKNQPQLRRK